MTRLFLTHTPAPVLAVLAAALLAASSCDVHEWPDEGIPATLEIELAFAGDMSDYKEVHYDTRNPGLSLTPAELDIRYTLKFYRALPEGGYAASEAADYTRVMTRPATEEPDCRFTVPLPEGEWQVRCWTDYVRKGSVNDLFYETADFASIMVPEDYTANTDYKDAFHGRAEASPRRVSGSEAPAAVRLEMRRPLAKYRFIATDYEELVNKIMRERAAASSTTKAPNPDDFYVRFHYTSFLPCAFSVFKDKPTDSRTGVSFGSELTRISGKETLMGFDYVLVNGHESGVYVQVAVHDRATDNLLSLTPPILVPVVRDKVTTVRGDFLTIGVDVDGGIGVNPEFDGEYNLTIP